MGCSVKVCQSVTGGKGPEVNETVEGDTSCDPDLLFQFAKIFFDNL